MAPDLETIIRAEWLNKKRAKAIARASRSQDGFSLAAEGPFFGGPWRLATWEMHDLLTDEADWGAVAWAMDPAGLERLARTLEWLYDELPGEFTFEARWGNEELIEKLVSRPELLRIVRAGQIGTRSRYRVPAAGAQPT
jgi:hypothetical protein